MFDATEEILFFVSLYFVTNLHNDDFRKHYATISIALFFMNSRIIKIPIKHFFIF